MKFKFKSKKFILGILLPILVISITTPIVFKILNNKKINPNYNYKWQGQLKTNKYKSFDFKKINSNEPKFLAGIQYTAYSQGISFLINMGKKMGWNWEDEKKIEKIHDPKFNWDKLDITKKESESVFLNTQRYKDYKSSKDKKPKFKINNFEKYFKEKATISIKNEKNPFPPLGNLMRKYFKNRKPLKTYFWELIDDVVWADISNDRILKNIDASSETVIKLDNNFNNLNNEEKLKKVLYLLNENSKKIFPNEKYAYDWSGYQLTKLAFLITKNKLFVWHYSGNSYASSLSYIIKNRKNIHRFNRDISLLSFEHKETTTQTQEFNLKNDLAKFDIEAKSSKKIDILSTFNKNDSKSKDDLGFTEPNNLSEGVTASYQVKEKIEGILFIEVTLTKDTETAKKQFVLNPKMVTSNIPQSEIDKMVKTITSTKTLIALNSLINNKRNLDELGLPKLLKSGYQLENGVSNDNIHYLIKDNQKLKIITILKKGADKIAHVIKVKPTLTKNLSQVWIDPLGSEGTLSHIPLFTSIKSDYHNNEESLKKLYRFYHGNGKWILKMDETNLKKWSSGNIFSSDLNQQIITKIPNNWNDIDIGKFITYNSFINASNPGEVVLKIFAGNLEKEFQRKYSYVKKLIKKYNEKLKSLPKKYFEELKKLINESDYPLLKEEIDKVDLKNKEKNVVNILNKIYDKLKNIKEEFKIDSKEKELNEIEKKLISIKNKIDKVKLKKEDLTDINKPLNSLYNLINEIVYPLKSIKSNIIQKFYKIQETKKKEEFYDMFMTFINNLKFNLFNNEKNILELTKKVSPLFISLLNFFKYNEFKKEDIKKAFEGVNNGSHYMLAVEIFLRGIKNLPEKQAKIKIPGILGIWLKIPKVENNEIIGMANTDQIFNLFNYMYNYKHMNIIGNFDPQTKKMIPIWDEKKSVKSIKDANGKIIKLLTCGCLYYSDKETKKYGIENAYRHHNTFDSRKERIMYFWEDLSSERKTGSEKNLYS